MDDPLKSSFNGLAGALSLVFVISQLKPRSWRGKER